MGFNTRDNNNNDSNTKNDDENMYNSSGHAERVRIIYTSDTHCRHTSHTISK